jgi:2,3-bisphosphoglycerate-dependent phosphoglycerate mutase
MEAQMKATKRNSFGTFGRLVVALMLLFACLALVPASAPEPLVVFLVRHAEKVLDGSSDPQLTPMGKERAQLLSILLRDSSIEQVHSSNFVRTRDTARPAAATLKLEVQQYDARDLEALVGELKKEGGRHLVVGHSNTTPDVVRLLGGKPGSPIVEADEYDRLYVVTIGSDGEVSTVLLRYGRPPAG